MKFNQLIRQGDFCQIITNQFEEYGVKNGHRVYIAGHKALPEDENDPYTQRIKFMVHLLKDKHVVAQQLYLMDPRSLAKVKTREQRSLQTILDADIALVELPGEVDETAVH